MPSTSTMILLPRTIGDYCDVRAYKRVQVQGTRIQEWSQRADSILLYHYCYLFPLFLLK